MKQKWHIILTNSIGGKLDERFAITQAQAKRECLAMIAELAYLNDGDTIRIVDRDPQE